MSFLEAQRRPCKGSGVLRKQDGIEKSKNRKFQINENFLRLHFIQ